MNDTLTQKQDNLQTGLPGWAFLLGWWFTTVGILDIISGWSSVIRVFPGVIPDATYSSYSSAFLFGLNGLRGLAYLPAGIILLRSQHRWQRYVRIVAFVLLLEALVRAVYPAIAAIVQDGTSSHFITGYLPYALSMVGTVFLFFWIIVKLEKSVHPDITALMFLLSISILRTIVHPLSALLQAMDGNTFGTRTSIEYVTYLAAGIAPILFPTLLGVAALFAHRKPLSILTTRYLILFPGVMFFLWSITQLGFFYSSSMNLSFEFFSILALQISDIITRYILPSVLVFIMAGRYRDSFRLSETYKFGLSNCTRCGYDLTGNTTGICPECGQYALPAPAKPKKPRIIYE